LKLSIRRAKNKDLDDIVQIERIAFSHNSFSRRAIRYHISNNLVLIALHNNKACGMIIASSLSKKRKIRIYSIAVHPDFKNNGIAIKLMEKMERISKAETIILEVDSDNNAAIGLYKKLNFFQFSTYKHYYGNNMHAIRMKKIFN